MTSEDLSTGVNLGIIRTRQRLNLAQKKMVVEYMELHPTLSVQDIRQWTKQKFNLPDLPGKSTINKYKADMEKYKNISVKRGQTKCIHKVQNTRLDNALIVRLRMMEAKHVPFCHTSIKEMAEEFSDRLGIPPEERLKFSNGWLRSFLSRHALERVSKKPEKKRETKIELAALRTAIDKYSPRDVFTMDETAICYSLNPSILASKKDKRFVISLTTNADGSERSISFIGHKKFLRGQGQKSAADHGFDSYYYNEYAMITVEIFQQILLDFDRWIGESASNRKVLLILDRIPTHDLGLIGLELINTEISFLPRPSNNYIQIYQPFDLGITTDIKREFLVKLLNHGISQALMRNPGEHDTIYKMNQLTAMKWCNSIWDSIPSETIWSSHCKSNIFTFQEVIKMHAQSYDLYNFLAEGCKIFNSYYTDTPINIDRMIQFELSDDCVHCIDSFQLYAEMDGFEDNEGEEGDSEEEDNVDSEDNDNNGSDDDLNCLKYRKMIFYCTEMIKLFDDSKLFENTDDNPTVFKSLTNEEKISTQSVLTKMLGDVTMFEHLRRAGFERSKEQTTIEYSQFDDL